jgi:DNA end-binding protein Ku
MPAIVWKGFVSFGLVSFPVRLFAAARPETVHFHMLHGKDLSRVKEVWYCAKENQRIERSEIVKGYEVAKDEYVVVDDEDLKKIAPLTASTMEIVQFVRGGEVDPVYYERSYYIAPGQDLDKPYALFLKALEDSKYHAIAKLSMHGREHVVLIRPVEGGMILHTLFYADELHAENRQKETAKTQPKPKEMELAKTLIKQLAGPFKPAQFHDTYRENVETLIEQKRKGQKVTATERPKKAKVIDLMEALQRSLKTPAKSHPRGRVRGKAA